jgi:hypothetical protein
MINKEELIHWIQKELKTSIECAKNSRVVFDGLKVEMDKFDRKDPTINVYTVRLGLDHRISAEKDEYAAKMFQNILDLVELK